MENITNVKLLQEAITAAKVPRTALAASLGMSMPTLYNRISGKSEFTATEIVVATKCLKLTKQQRDAIFFGE